MKIKHLLFAAVAAVFTLSACEQEKPTLGVSVDPATVSFDKDGGSYEVKIKTTDAWSLSGLPDGEDPWLVVTPESGSGNATVKVIAKSNSGKSRKATVTVKSGYYSAPITVSQDGAQADGDGLTAETAWSPSEARAWITKNLSSGQSTTQKYFVKGVIHKIAQYQGADQYFTGNSYGNASFYMADDLENTSNDFEAYQVNYLGNRAFEQGSDVDIQIGDEVIVYGPVTLYEKTPETVGKGAAFIYSLNGKVEDVEIVDPGTAKGTGTLDDPYNPAGAAAACSGLTYTNTTTYDTTDPVYVRGKISKVSTSFEASGEYGNANFYITDVDDGTGEFYIFQTYYLENRKWEAGDAEVKVGDIVVVYGPLMNYMGNTPETEGKGASYIYSLNGETSIEQAPVFGVESAAITVAASATSATINVKGNVAWTASSTDATVDPQSGEGKGAVTVTFDANTDTDNTKTYNVTLSTEADVEVKSIEVVITQKAASAGGEDIVLTFPDDNSEKNQVGAYDKTWTAIKGDYSWTIFGYNNNKWGNEWTFIRTGRKSAAVVATISTDQLFPDPVGEVIVTFDKISAADKIKSAKLICATDKEFKENVAESSVTLENVTAATPVTFTVANPSVSYFYKLELDIDVAGANGTVQISKIVYSVN